MSETLQGPTSRPPAVRLVALTLLGAAAIVPALLVRPLLSARFTLELAERVRGDMDPSEPRSTGGTGAIESAETNRRIDLLLAPTRTASSSENARFFSKEIEQASNPLSGGAGMSGAAAIRPPVSVLAPPVDLAADVVSLSPFRPLAPHRSERGDFERSPPASLAAERRPLAVRVAWRDNPQTPPGSIVKSVVYRWSHRDAPVAIHTAPPVTVGERGAPTPALEAGREDAAAVRRDASGLHEFWDAEVCEGLTYTYAVRAIQFDRLEGIEVRRSALSDALSVDVGRVFDFEVRDFLDPSRALESQSLGRAEREAITRALPFRIDVVDRRPEPPLRKTIETTFEAIGDRDLGIVAFGFEIGWRVVAIDIEARTEILEIVKPVFQPDGSIQVEAAEARDEATSEFPPSSRAVVTREVEVLRKGSPVLRLRNRCGTETTIRASVSRSRDSGVLPAKPTPR